MKKKIAFLVNGVNAGGTENYLLRFLSFYIDKIDATVYCKSGRLGELENEFRNLGVNLKPFHLGYFNFRDYYKLRKDFIKSNYDSVCDLTGSFGAVPLLIAKLAGIKKRVGFFRNSSEKFQKTFFKVQYNRLITWILPNVATNVLSNSKSALNYFYNDRWERNNKFQVIYNGLDSNIFLDNSGDLRDELKISSNAFVVGHVGRLNEQKNHETAINVAIELCKEHPDVYFIFCGKNVDVAYSELVSKQNLSERILLLGMRRDICKVLRTMDCFYFPSKVEGQPNALIEAMMVGLPFVTSDIDPIKETVPEKFHTQLVSPTDIIEAKRKILEVKNSHALRRRLNLSDWTCEYYRPEKWFSMFYEKI
ncbi:glycosyltransferase [Sphingobacterium hungaricum]|uniref:Glycosyl transferase n=1 Tax=Sphingobacterium hungaricum TaxID=2082723 RepID=A0A928V0X5_9SPHI|nr:glycosyltransferase [Sphingobacterium hungaricum]MBE8714124.1 glycosyl transferase [Sphingobacterium hungaricum]